MDQARKWYGKYRGLVVDNHDPTGLGRIKARVPQVLGEDVCPWAMPCVPYAGDGSGVYLVPEPGAGVWIEFEGGDPGYPIWSGCWWGPDQIPCNANGTSNTPPLKIVRSESGLMLTLDDDALHVTLSDAHGSNCMRIEAKEGQVRIKAAAKVIVEAPQIEWVANATQPVVLGEALLQYLNQLVALFNSHLHPGQVAAGFIPVTPAPPVPPLPPATSGLLSQKVKTG